MPKEELVIREVRSGQEDEINDLASMERNIFSDAWSKRAIQETLGQNHSAALGIWKGDFLAGYVSLPVHHMNRAALGHQKQLVKVVGVQPVGGVHPALAQGFASGLAHGIFRLTQ